jgi:hypothetical protein
MEVATRATPMNVAGLRTGGGLGEVTKKAEEKKPVFTARNFVSQIRR